MRFQTERFDALAHGANLFFRGVRLHDNQHGRVSSKRNGAKIQCTVQAITEQTRRE
jgi:hypothetical protein